MPSKCLLNRTDFLWSFRGATFLEDNLKISISIDINYISMDDGYMDIIYLLMLSFDPRAPFFKSFSCRDSLHMSKSI